MHSAFPASIDSDMTMNRMKSPIYRKLSFVIAAYLLIVVFFFSTSLLFWTYRTSDEAVNRETGTLFDQQHAIFEIVFHQKVDKIEGLLRDIQRDPRFSIQLQSNNRQIIQKTLLQILDTNEDYDLDLLFIRRLDDRVWIDASSALFDSDAIPADINRDEKNKKPLTGIRRFTDTGKDLTTVMLSVPLIHWNTGRVFGNLLGGYVLNDNLSIMEAMRNYTQSVAIAMFHNGDVLGSTVLAESALAQALVRTRQQVAPGRIFSTEGHLLSYQPLVVAGAATSVEIATAIPDNTYALLRRSFLQKAAATSILTILFLVLTLYLTRRLTVPSLRRLIAYTDDLASGRMDSAFNQGYIHEFNQIGQAMDSMAHRLQASDRQRRELEHIINLSPVVVFQWKAETRWPVTFVSENVRQFGYTPQAFLTRELFFTDIIHPADRERVARDVAGYSTGAASEFIQEYRIITKTREARWVEDRTWATRDSKGRITHYHGVILDISKRKKAAGEKAELEAQLMRSKKMEALGLLAGGVAHDLNNILSGIVSYPELILMNMDQDDELRKPLLTIMDSGKRAAAVVQDLLTIARGVASSKQITNLNTIWEDHCRSPEYRQLRSLFPGLVVKTRLNPDLMNIRCSVVHIKKVMMNLLSNAMEAIGDAGEGEVTVTTENRYVDWPMKGFDEVMVGEYAVLGVIDNGPGIAPEDRNRIFEPFYTKKVMGRSGTGLGLAVVWNTLLDHEGYVSIDSKEGKTVFELFFPVCRGTEEKINGGPAIESLMGKGETILVVDDEKNQQEIACGMLERLGYSPVAVSSGEAAVEHLKSYPADILLLDMLMPPGITGLETYRRIIAFQPGQKAIIASGFSESKDVRDTQQLGAGQYLKKPYTMQKLGQAIRMELDRL